MSPKTAQKKHGGKNHRNPTSKDTPLGEYFAKYHSGFDLDPVDSAEKEFYRVCDKYGWEQESSKPQDATREAPEPKHGATQPNTSSSELPGPIQAFFAGYAPRFEYDPTASSSSEFLRLCDVFGWHKEHLERQTAHQQFEDALVLQFNEIYGTDAHNIKSWQNLCGVVRINPIPNDLHACRQAVCRTYINLVDLVDTKRTGRKVEVFETERKLAQYTHSTGKIFPKENARAGGILQHLLQPVFFPFSAGPSMPFSHWG